MATTVVKKCTCSSPFQDTIYGKGMRLHNVNSKGEGCTVCGKGKVPHNSIDREPNLAKK